MPWCPRCKSEYKEGYMICSECGSPLEEGWLPEGDSFPPMDTPALLMEVSSENEAHNMKAILEGEGIPVYASHRGAGQYTSIYMGLSNQGLRIFVPQSSLEVAREILESARQPAGQTMETDSGSISMGTAASEDEAVDLREKEQETSYGKRRRWFARILVLPSLIILLIVLLYALYGYLASILNR